jgi:DNA-binding NtrC family response regulator
MASPPHFHSNKESHRVISVGKLPKLLWLRQVILRSAGYKVFTFTEPKYALSKIEDGKWEVLLICYSLPEEWRHQLVQKFRELCPEGRVVFVTDRPVVETPKDADELVYGVEGPEILIDAVRGKAA